MDTSVIIALMGIISAIVGYLVGCRMHRAETVGSALTYSTAMNVH